nr:MAG TPA: hypothetical protein [Caudoviricetes sp.]
MSIVLLVISMKIINYYIYNHSLFIFLLYHILCK